MSAFCHRMFVGCAFLVLSGFCAASTRDAAQDTTVVYIVRHADRPDDKDKLTKEGLARADALRWILHAVSLDAVYTTDYRRTRRTVEPTATAKGLPIERYGYWGLKKLITKSSQRGKTLLVAGHSDSIPKALEELGFAIAPGLLQVFNDLFVVVLHRDEEGGISGKKLYRLKYAGKPGGEDLCPPKGKN